MKREHELRGSGRTTRIKLQTVNAVMKNPGHRICMVAWSMSYALTLVRGIADIFVAMGVPVKLNGYVLTVDLFEGPVEIKAMSFTQYVGRTQLHTGLNIAICDHHYKD